MLAALVFQAHGGIMRCEISPVDQQHGLTHNVQHRLPEEVDR
jgi:hypothetical protein